MPSGIYKRTEELNRLRQNEGHPGWKGGCSYSYKLKQMKKLVSRPKPNHCEICGIFEKDLKKKLCFDHDHETGKFRGWICMRCNLILGQAKDKIEILSLLIKYLEKNKD